MTDLLERLQSAVAGRYTIQRELGRGRGTPDPRPGAASGERFTRTDAIWPNAAKPADSE